MQCGERLSQWLDEPAAELSAQELVEHLAEIVQQESLPREHSDAGRVRAVSAVSARSLSAPYVFFAGLSEKAFPQPDREDRIYGEADIARLAEAGLPLVPRAERSQEEMLLFYEVLTRATCRLWLSYPALDEKAQPLSPSPYLTEVERACGEGRIQRHSELQLTPVPQSLDLCSERELRVKAVAQGMDGVASLLGGLCRRGATAGLPSSAMDATAGGGPSGGSSATSRLGKPTVAPELEQSQGTAADNILAALRMAQTRRGRSFGTFDGMLESDAVRRQLTARFGPESLLESQSIRAVRRVPAPVFPGARAQAGAVGRPGIGG